MVGVRKIRLVRITHVSYIHEDIEKAHKFLNDFGLTETARIGETRYYKGYGTQPYVYTATPGKENKFDGACFSVESLEDLEIASQTIPNATSIYDSKAPGNGKMVTFHDPVDDFPFHLIWGQQLKDFDHEGELPELTYNYPAHKPRPVNRYQRFQHGPAPVHKLGHFGACVTDFAKAYEFYTSRFNFKPSELNYGPDGKDNATFLHLDRGSEPVDHHTFFFFEGPKYHVHHSSFEVHDFDIQSLGHQHLRKQGYDLVWGIGRHIMGSQVFDYWWDQSGFIVEHYVDGDLVDETTPVNRTPASPDGLHVWGPPLPPTFLT